MQARTNRREFLAGSLAAGAIGCGVFINPAPAAESDSPNEKLNIAYVGVANKGWHNVQQLTSQNTVALCDVDVNYLDRASQSFPNAKRYRDYRKMLDAEAKNIDAMVVSTADHTHAPATSLALHLGKHAYCEKPLSHTVPEARALAELAKKNKLATQMGTQIHAGSNYRRVVEVIRSGAIGTVTEVYNWCNKGWSNGRFKAWDKPVPANLDWDLWLGPAKKRPYSPDIHPANWRRFWEYGSGTFGDMACHVMDLPFWALDLRHPTSVVCEGPEVHPDGAPSWVKASYDFPAAGDRAALKFHWSDGGAHFDKVSSTAGHNGRPLSSWGLGILFVGDKGMLAADYGRYEMLPKESFADFKPPERSIAESVGHWKEWVDACKTGSATTCNFDYSGALTETVLLGIVAYRTGEKLQWDAKILKATNCPKADEFLNKDYPMGFKVIGLS